MSNYVSVEGSIVYDNYQDFKKAESAVEMDDFDVKVEDDQIHVNIPYSLYRGLNGVIPDMIENAVDYHIVEFCVDGLVFSNIYTPDKHVHLNRDDLESVVRERPERESFIEEREYDYERNNWENDVEDQIFHNTEEVIVNQ